MGTVFKARHRRMKRIVALKVLSRSLAKDAIVRPAVPARGRDHRPVEPSRTSSWPTMRTRPKRAISWYGVRRRPGPGHAGAEAGAPDGAGSGRLHPAGGAGLEYAHGQGIIHRDIKPANLLRDVSGVVKVADLGLARFSDQSERCRRAGRVTQAGSIMGTVDFMPPEQAMDSTDIDHRADIYSLGATLHFLLLGRPPYQGASLMATLLKHRDAPIPSLADARADVPAALDAVFQPHDGERACRPLPDDDRSRGSAGSDRWQTWPRRRRRLRRGLGPAERTSWRPGDVRARVRPRQSDRRPLPGATTRRST